MNTDKYFGRRMKLSNENILLKFAIVFFAFAAVISSITSLIALNSTKIILTPPSIDKKIVIEDGSMNKDGLLMFTRYSFDLFLNHTPSSASQKFNEFIKLVHTNYYSNIHEEIEKKIATIERLKIVSTFNIEEIKLDEEKRTIKVKGIRSLKSFGKYMGDNPNPIETWHLIYRITDSNFKIEKIEKDE